MKNGSPAKPPSLRLSRHPNPSAVRVCRTAATLRGSEAVRFGVGDLRPDRLGAGRANCRGGEQQQSGSEECDYERDRCSHARDISGIPGAVTDDGEVEAHRGSDLGFALAPGIPLISLSCAYAPCQRSLPSFAVAQTIAFPVSEMPPEPAFEQNEPGCTVPELALGAGGGV